jgi:hypothetical protein
MFGPGQVYQGKTALPATSGGWYPVLTTTNPALIVGYNCPADLNTNGVLVFVNNSPEVVNVFSDNGGPDPAYQQLAANGGRWDQFSNKAGEHITIQVQGSQVTTFEIFAVHRNSSNDCHIEAQAVVAR